MSDFLDFVILAPQSTIQTVTTKSFKITGSYCNPFACQPSMFYQLVCIFVIINYHKFSGLKHDKYIILQFWVGHLKTRLPGLNSKYWQVSLLLWRLWRRFVSMSFVASKDHPHSLVHGLFLHPQSQQHFVCLCLFSQPYLPLTLSFCFALLGKDAPEYQKCKIISLSWSQLLSSPNSISNLISLSHATYVACSISTD